MATAFRCVFRFVAIWALRNASWTAALTNDRRSHMLALRGGEAEARDAVEAVGVQLIESGTVGRAAIVCGLEVLRLLDEYAPPVGAVTRVAWRSLCEEQLGPRWAAALQNRKQAEQLAKEAADPRTDTFQRRHTYYGLTPAEVDDILSKPFDKYARVTVDFMRAEALGDFGRASRPGFSLRRAAIEKARLVNRNDFIITPSLPQSETTIRARGRR